MKIDDYISNARPLDAEEAVRVRGFVATEPAMRRFPIDADFDGLKYSFYIYITNIPWPKDPLEDQARWLEEERGGTIRQKDRENFRMLQSRAHANNDSFVELCDKAFAKDDPADAKNVEKYKKKKAALLAEIADRSRQLEAGPSTASRLALARSYEELAAVYKDLAEAKERVRACEQAQQLYEAELRGRPVSPEILEHVAEIEYQLGDAYHHGGEDFTKSHAAYQRSLALLDQLASRGGTTADFVKDRVRTMTAIGDICASALTPAEAMCWYVKAMELDDSAVASKIASTYLDHPEVAAILPESTRQILVRAARETGNDPRACRERFAAELEKVRLRRREETMARLREEVAEWHDLAAAYRGKGRDPDLRKALIKEFEALRQQVGLAPSDPTLARDQASVADEIARSFADSKQMEAAVLWTERAADLGHAESLLRLSDWLERGTNVKVDPRKASRYRYGGHLLRGVAAFSERRYADALPDVLKACESTDAVSKEAGSMAYNLLGLCYAKLDRWDDAVKAYTRSVELDVKGDKTTDRVLNALQAMVVAERAEQALDLVEKIKAKGWTPRTGAFGNALYHGFRALALTMSGKDASEAERSMREFTGREDYAATEWGWDELDGWLKRTKLAPDRKAAVEKIVAGLKGTSAK
jgi:tetratricopeptide (TPR) repeat protein